ncbi:MAG TPA: hypothetical protein VFS11_07960 [Gemmatimonadales bacterium]|nr:hypothetical protein [Gemmatimonadales bacterium]
MWVAAVFVLACLVYLQTVAYGFAGDDIGIIRDRPLYHDLANWREILTTSWWAHALYRPVTAISLAANWVVAGGDPRAFHLVNLLLHAVAALLVYRLARELVPFAAAVAAGLVFAVHPVHVEAVANLVGRAEVLATIFVLAAVLLYRADGRLADAGDHGSLRRAGATLGTLAAAVLALGAKESAFALPALLLLSDWADARARERPFASALRRHPLLWVGVVVVAAGWLVLRSRVVGDVTGLEVAPGLEDQGMLGRTVIMLPIALHYARLLFFPARLSVEYSPNFIPVRTDFTLAALLGAALVLGALTAALVARRRVPAVTVALGWIGATVLIVANILVPTGILLAERTLYLPSVGAALLIGVGWQAARDRSPRIAPMVLAVLLLAGATRTMTRNPIWRDDTTYYPAMVQDAPGSFRAYWTAAELARQRGDLRESERLLRQALDAHPLAWAVWQDLGKLLYSEGRYAEAGDAFWAAWRITGGSAFQAQRAVVSNLQAGRVDTAAALLQRAVAARPNMPVELVLAASDVARARGEFLRSMTLRRTAALNFPDSTRYWNLTAEAAVLARHCPGLLHSRARLEALPDGREPARQLDAAVRELGCAR